jgi:OmpA-OmpF porin, OOP family
LYPGPAKSAGTLKNEEMEMARNIVGPRILIALAAAAAPVIGCHAELTAGSGTPTTPATPPPPAPTPAPVATPAAPAATPAPAAAPEPAAPAPAAIKNTDGKLSVPGNIVYETGKAVIKPESEPTLKALKDYIDKNPNFTRIRIEGHTDNVGNKDANLKLSIDRAMAVVTWLGSNGIDKKRLLAVGFGDSKPIADNAKEDGKAQNRRTEFHIAEVNSKPYRGRDETNGGKVADGQAAVTK